MIRSDGAPTATSESASGECASPREFAAMFTVAVALRVLVFVLMIVWGGFAVRDYAEWADGKSYLWMAQTIGGAPPPYLREYDYRVFPGFPALLSLAFLLKLPLAWVALTINWLTAGLSAVFAAKICNDRRIGWAVATFTPQWLLDSSMAMTESMMVCLMLGGVLLAQRKRGVLGGVLSGLGGLVRPMVCFAVIGQMVQDAWQRRWRQAFLHGLAAAVTVGAGYLILQLTTGDALRGPRVYATHEWAYGGHMFALPGYSIYATTRYEHVPPWTLAYILVHVPIVLAACLMLLVQWWRDRERADPLLPLMAPWLWTNTFFVLCVGAQWGLLQFPRLILVALLPLLWTFRAWLPRRAAGYVIFAAISVFISVTMFTLI